MLAQNFKTATDLGITDVERESLVKVLGMFERREITGKFDMSQIHNACGTPACICGWANFVSKGAAFPLTERSSDGKPMPKWGDMPKKVLELFFYSNFAPPCAEKARPAHAALALRNFLTDGEARWEEACAE